MKTLAEVESERDRDEVLIGCAFDADAKEGDTFAKLARYETISSDRSFGTSVSFARCRRSVETVGHPRCQMRLRRTQTIPNDKLSASGAYRPSAAKAHSINARL
jgi:hypothetical protein